MRKVLVICIILLTFAVRGNEYEEIVEVLKHVETNNRPDMIGDNGDSYGILQIQWRAVQDVNKHFDTNYSHEDMFQVECAEEVTILYMKMGAEHYRKKHGKEPTEEVLVRNHNGGIYKGYRVNATKKYYRRYLFYKNLIKSE